MNCPKCGGKLYINQYQYHCNGCDRYYDVCYFHDRAEKAEGELKAIKARIDKNKINYIINHHLQKYNFNMGAFEPEPFIELVSNLIKQIGGEK